MSRFELSRRTRIAAGGAVLLGLGAAAGAGAVSLTRPSIQMAPSVPTAIAGLARSSGIVTIKGRVAEVFGDRVVVQDASGRTMIDVGRDARSAIVAGAPLTAQGRYDDGQLRVAYVVASNGQVYAVGPGGRGPGSRGPGEREPRGPGRRGPGADGPPAPADACAPPAPAPVASAPAATSQQATPSR